MVNGSRYYRSLLSVSIASALSTALTIYPCQIRVHQRRQSYSKLTAWKKQWWPVTADSSPRWLPVNTVIHTTLVGLEPTNFRLLVRRATSSATDSPVQYMNLKIPVFVPVRNLLPEWGKSTENDWLYMQHYALIGRLSLIHI